MPRKRNTKHNESILKEFAQQVQAEHGNIKYALNPKGEISMSDAISKLIEPYSDDAPTYDAFNNLVTFACIAWNATLVSKEKQDELIDKMIQSVHKNIEDRLEILQLITDLMDRKKKLFPNISRMIMKYKVADQGSGFHIAIASTMEEKNQSDVL